MCTKFLEELSVRDKSILSPETGIPNKNFISCKEMVVSTNGKMKVLVFGVQNSAKARLISGLYLISCKEERIPSQIPDIPRFWRI